MNHLTVAQNIFIGREPGRRLGVFLDEDKLNRQAQEILDHMHLKLDPSAIVGGLTVAKQQMVEIAKALSFNSRVLIMDEPTAALNNAEIAELFNIIRELKARGVGIVYISHKMEELKQISDRVTVLRDGEYVATVPTPTTSLDLTRTVRCIAVWGKVSHFNSIVRCGMKPLDFCGATLLCGHIIPLETERLPPCDRTTGPEARVRLLPGTCGVRQRAASVDDLRL